MRVVGAIIAGGLYGLAAVLISYAVTAAGAHRGR